MKRSVSLVLLVTLLLSLLCPAQAAETKQTVAVSLTQSVAEITTPHLQDLKIQVKNLENIPKDIRLVMAQTDYKGVSLSRAVSALTLKENSTTEAQKYLKILPGAYQVEIFVENTAGVRISNLLTLPIASGFSVEDIQSISPIHSTVPQGAKYTLPSTVNATLYTGGTIAVPVIWDIPDPTKLEVDTSRPGVQTISGRVEGFSGQKVQLTVNVLEAAQITSIPTIKVTVGVGMTYTLPTTVPAQDENGETIHVPVLWDAAPAVDTSKAATTVFTGTAPCCGKEVTLELTVIAYDPGDPFTFANSEIEGQVLDDLWQDSVTYADIAGIKSLSFPYGLYTYNMEDLRWFTSLTSLDLQSYGGSQLTDLSPLANLNFLTELNLFGNASLENLAPLAGLSLTKLNLGAITLSDYSPVYGIYDNLSTTDKERIKFHPLDIVNGQGTLKIPSNASYTLPLYVRINGEFVPVAWDMLEIPAQPSGELSLGGTRMDDRSAVSLRVVVSDEAVDEPIPYWVDKHMEAAVRKMIDKPHGDIYRSDVKYLKQLDCFGQGIYSLADLKYMPSLTYLGLSYNELEDEDLNTIKTLAKDGHFKNLQYLDLAGNRFSKLPKDMLINMPNLVELCMDDTKLTTIESGAFNGQVNLATFMAEDNPNLKNIDEVKKITGLKDLFISRTGVINLDCVKDAVGLTELWADECAITDLSPLAGKPDLYRVKLKHKQGSEKITSIAPLEDALSLYWLDITDQNVSSVDALYGKTDLNFLAANNNAIHDLSPLATCSKLETLYLNNNQVSDVAPLAKLPLVSLYLKNNNITDVSSLAGLKTLKNLYLFGNYGITDFSPLDTIRDKLIGKDF